MEAEAFLLCIIVWSFFLFPLNKGSFDIFAFLFFFDIFCFFCFLVFFDLFCFISFNAIFISFSFILLYFLLKSLIFCSLIPWYILCSSLSPLFKLTFLITLVPFPSNNFWCEIFSIPSFSFYYHEFFFHL